MKMVVYTIARNFELLEVATEDRFPPKKRLAFTNDVGEHIVEAWQ
jgi:hypothetical protein